MKIHTVKISKTFCSGLLLFLFLSFCAIFIFLCIKAGQAVALESMGQNLAANEHTIVIDAGHGGEDGGTTSAEGLLEKEVNLKIAKELNRLLKNAGYQTVMLRDEDEDLGDDSLLTVKERKTSDLHKRAQLVNETKNPILISIHQNYFEQTRYSGAQIFYSSNHEKSKVLAECVRYRIVENTQPQNNRELKEGNGNIFLLREVNCPAILAECGFLSNREEAEKLSREEYQKEIAYSVYQGLCDFLREN